MLSPSDDIQPTSTWNAYLAGIRAAVTSVFFYVLIGTYIGIGALAHDFGFSVGWVLLSTILIWAGPAQVILISALGAGAAHVEVAIAVGLSGVRLLPMVVALLPMLKMPNTSSWRLVMPAHFTAISMWVESLRLLPKVARENRVAFCNGIGSGLFISASSSTVVGYYLAAGLPALITAALLFLTPISFLVSTARNARDLVDKLALAFGLILGPILAWKQVDLDLVWTGIIGGTLAYAAHRFRWALR
jgi:predicted branched-subunit amino acid permease